MKVQKPKPPNSQGSQMRGAPHRSKSFKSEILGRTKICMKPSSRPGGRAKATVHLLNAWRTPETSGRGLRASSRRSPVFFNGATTEYAYPKATEWRKTPSVGRLVSTAAPVCIRRKHHQKGATLCAKVPQTWVTESARCSSPSSRRMACFHIRKQY